MRFVATFDVNPPSDDKDFACEIAGFLERRMGDSYIRNVTVWTPGDFALDVEEHGLAKTIEAL